MNRKSKGIGLGIALGAALGVALGVMAGHIAIWLGIGVAIAWPSAALCGEPPAPIAKAAKRNQQLVSKS